MALENENEPIDSEWDKRTLCSDGNCIGVIGNDGRCKVCGLPYEGELPSQAAPEAQQYMETEAESTTLAESEKQTDTGSDEIPDEDWENRKLCSDGNCIGVIGPDGLCKECGKPYAK